MKGNKTIRVGVLDFGSIQEAIEGEWLSVKKINKIKIFTDTIKKLGYVPVVYKVDRCQMFFGNKGASIFYNNKPIKGCDVLIPRLDFSTNLDLEISIIKQFESMGIPVVNTHMSILKSKNKLRTLQILTKDKIPVPKTLVVRKLDYLDDVIKKIGGYPVIVKAPFGSHGKEVAMLESKRSLTSALDIMWKQNRTSIILIQEYVYEAGDSDVRAFVVGDKVIASMKRTAVKGDFRANLQLGGIASSTKLSKEEKSMVIKSTKSLGLNVCGVDLLRTKTGSLIMEVNANPDVLEITKICETNVVEEIIKFAVSLAVKSRIK